MKLLKTTDSHAANTVAVLVWDCLWVCVTYFFIWYWGSSSSWWSHVWESMTPSWLPMTQFYWVAVHGNIKQKPGMCNFDTCGSNRSETMLGHCCLDRLGWGLGSRMHYNWRPRSWIMRSRICSNSAFVIIPLLRSISKASTRLSVLLVKETLHPSADTPVGVGLLWGGITTAAKHGPLCASFTARSKKGEIEFDVQSSNTHIVIAWWQVGIADVHTYADQIVSTSRFGE